MKFLEKNSFSELFALKHNDDFHSLWKMLKKAIISGLTLLELMNYQESYERINEARKSSLRNMSRFFEGNRQNLFNMKERGHFFVNYLFSIITAFLALLITTVLIYRSPKLQAKKFVWFFSSKKPFDFCRKNYYFIGIFKNFIFFS